MMETYWKYFMYVIKHKYFVAKECFKLGLFWQGLMHDLSKFKPYEFISYARFFYSKGQPKNTGNTVHQGNNKILKNEMEKAWLFHIHSNPHHWNYWISIERGGKLQIFDMPYKYILEMVCDWEGASKALRGKKAKALDWYNDQKNEIVLSEKTRLIVEELLNPSGFYGLY